VKQNFCKNSIGLTLISGSSHVLNCNSFVMDTKLRGLQLHIRERAAEVEKEIERQRLMELERAKTKELRHNLDMEKERQTQVRTLPHSI
jgi:uncharacterized NAD(P)/FAD-binding protein YdhS